VRTLERLERILLGARTVHAAAALKRLVDIAGPEALAVVMKGLRRPDMATMCKAGVGLLGEEAGFDALAALLGPGMPPQVVEGLGRTRDPRALERLAAYLDDPRFAPAAYRGLGRLANEDAYRLLWTGLFHDRWWRYALEGFSLCDDRRVLPTLRRFRDVARSLGYADRAAAAMEALGGIQRGR
jgi:hypothetical protein